MNLNIKNKNVLITGASKNIGKSIAIAMAKEGCNVVICARDKEKLNDMPSDLIVKAKKEFQERFYNIDLKKCIMIGDSYIDIAPATKLGMRSLFILEGNGKKDLNKFDHLCKPNYIAENLFLGAKELIK